MHIILKNIKKKNAIVFAFIWLIIIKPFDRVEEPYLTETGGRIWAWNLIGRCSFTQMGDSKGKSNLWNRSFHRNWLYKLKDRVHELSLKLQK